MARAAVVRTEGGEVVQDETAWGGAEEFNSQRFAYYFTVTICEPEDEDPNGEDPNGEDPKDKLPVTGTLFGWLITPGLAMAGAGLTVLRRPR
jgi:hypothetical protein